MWFIFYYEKIKESLNRINWIGSVGFYKMCGIIYIKCIIKVKLGFINVYIFF